MGWYDRRLRQVCDLPSAGFRIVLELEVRRLACRRCGKVKRERLDFLADNARFTKRFAFYVGRRCRQASIRDVAKELRLDWDTVKTLGLKKSRKIKLAVMDMWKRVLQRQRGRRFGLAVKLRER